MCGCSVVVFSKPNASCLATIPAMYSSMVSISDIGRLSLSDCGFGMGILVVCFALTGRILWMSVSSMSFSIAVVHWGGSRANRFSVKPSSLALPGMGLRSPTGVHVEEALRKDHHDEVEDHYP